MTKKYVYSAIQERYARPRVLEVSKEGEKVVVPKMSQGSAVSYGNFLDTSKPYTTIAELYKDRYKDHNAGNLVTHGQKRGLVWLRGEKSNTVWSVFAHSVSKPGIHYLVEWKKKNIRQQAPRNEDYSPLYSSYEEALNQTEAHIAKEARSLSDMGVESIKRVDDKKNSRFKLLSGLIVDGDPNNVDHYRIHGEYRIIPIVIDKETYEQASEQIDGTYHVHTPWIHFDSEATNGKDI